MYVREGDTEREGAEDLSSTSAHAQRWTQDSPAQKDGYVRACFFFFVSEKEIQRERVLKISPQLLHVHKGGRKTLPCKMDMCVRVSFFIFHAQKWMRVCAYA